MPTCLFLNGRFYGGEPQGGAGAQPVAAPAVAQAHVSCFDAGFQHAVGLFETMTGGVLRRGVEGARSHGEETETWILQLDEHMERLANSAAALGSDQLKPGALGEASLETVRRSGLERARVRVTVTPGDLSLLTAPPGAKSADPTIMIVAQPATAYPDEMFANGVRITLAETRANPLNPTEGHKTLNYWWRLRELQKAGAKQASEALVLTVTNHVAGGCVSNVLIVKGEEVLTPIARGEELEVAGPESKPIPSCVLPGIVRAWALEKAERLGFTVKKQLLTVQDVLNADEVMLTNSSWGVLPIVKLEANELGGEGGGKPGRLSMDLRDAWVDEMPSADRL